MKKKWLEIDKATKFIKKKVETAVDEEQKLLKMCSEQQPIDETKLKELKKRKQVESQT